jgi:RNA polymerase sigma factor (sigma-70 family)
MVFTDEALIRQCLDGDTDAFGFLVDKYKGAVYALAYHKIGNHHDAEDMAQETFLKAYQRLSTLRNTSGFAGWLYVICANCCYSWLRKRRKEKETVVPLRQLSHAEVSDSSYAKYANEQIEESVREAIDALPESERTVITLHYLGGLSCQEIGRFLGVSLSAAKMRLFRARSQLKERMIEMLEQTWGRSQIGSGFTFHLMETVQRMSPFSVPRPDFRRWVPIGALMATLILRFGSLFVSSTMPPFSLGDTQKNIEVMLLNLPQQEDNPQVNLPIVSIFFLDVLLEPRYSIVPVWLCCAGQITHFCSKPC